MRTGACIRREFGPNSGNLACKNNGTLLNKTVVSQGFPKCQCGCCPKI